MRTRLKEYEANSLIFLSFFLISCNSCNFAFIYSFERVIFLCCLSFFVSPIYLRTKQGNNYLLYTDFESWILVVGCFVAPIVQPF